MQYRIVEILVDLGNSQPNSIFKVQKKYKYWPFWMALDRLGCRWHYSLGEAKNVLEKYKGVKNTPLKIHNIQ
jgi:hypothetical protein